MAPTGSGGAALADGDQDGAGAHGSVDAHFSRMCSLFKPMPRN